MLPSRPGCTRGDSERQSADDQKNCDRGLRTDSSEQRTSQDNQEHARSGGDRRGRSRSDRQDYRDRRQRKDDDPRPRWRKSNECHDAQCSRITEGLL